MREPRKIAYAQELFGAIFTAAERNLNLLGRIEAIVKENFSTLDVGDYFEYRRLIVEIEYLLKLLFRVHQDDFCREMLSKTTFELHSPEFSSEEIRELEKLEEAMGIEFWSKDNKGSISLRLHRCRNVFLAHQSNVETLNTSPEEPEEEEV